MVIGFILGGLMVGAVYSLGRYEGAAERRAIIAEADTIELHAFEKCYPRDTTHRPIRKDYR